MLSMPEERLRRARIALEGLSVGDAFGERFFREVNQALIPSRQLPEPRWFYTDDTNMAMSIYQNLRLYGEIRQDELALSFARHYSMLRGYGPAMHGFLARVGAGEHWKAVSQSLFNGQGSFGNGAAMRIAPLGAYFADDLDKVVEQATLSAEITHAHAEGIIGAVTTAVATACAWRLKETNERPSRKAFIDLVFPYISGSLVRERVRHARNLADDSSPMLAVAALGNGSQISAQDTVPFVLWCAGEYLNDYAEGMWQIVDSAGDIDTNCAMVGGIVASYVGVEGIPPEWLARREPLPAWAFEENS